MKDIETLTDLVREYKELGGNGFVIDYLNRYINGIDTSDKDSTITPATKNVVPKLTNCKNCGAPLHSNRCEFCDTQYDW